MNIRKKIYFLKDKYLHNSVVKNHLDDIREHYFFYHTDVNEQKRKERLKRILEYAKNNVPYYQHFQGLELCDFPVVNKSMIKENYENFLSTKFDMDKLFYVTTSGSTGTPFKSYRDGVKTERHNADNIFFNELAGGDVGMKLYYFRVWNNINRKNIFKKIIQNIVEVDANDFTETYVRELVRKTEKDTSQKFMLSYASSYEALVMMMKSLGLTDIKTRMNGIISMSESLPDQTRDFLEKAFHSKVFSRYSNMENGFIGQQCTAHKNEYHLNSGSFLVEILSLEGDFHVKDGEPGRIVVTDYFNYAMPFIRYDTGDIGVKSESECKLKGPVLMKVEGRRTDFIFSTSGKMLSPHIITNTMWKFPNVEQFQFIQQEKKIYLLKLNSKDRIDEKFLENEFKNFLGDDAVIILEYVDEIPLLSSGKRKKVINEYKTL